jgi:hypothetical protein
MIDPVSAFAMAQAAIAGVRKCVDLYKEAKSVAADVTEITSEVTTHIGTFLEAKETLEIATEEAKKKPPPKGYSLNKIAFDNIIRVRQLQEQERELREFMIYQTPGWGSIWSEFEEERARLRKEQEVAEQEAKKPLGWRLTKDVNLLRSIKSELSSWLPSSSWFLSLSV